MRSSQFALLLLLASATAQRISRENDVVADRARRDEEVSAFTLNDDLKKLATSGMMTLEKDLIDQVDILFADFETELSASLDSQFDRMMDEVASTIPAAQETTQAGVNRRVEAAEGKLAALNDKVYVAVQASADSSRKGVSESASDVRTLSKEIGFEYLRWLSTADQVDSKCRTMAEFDAVDEKVILTAAVKDNQDAVNAVQAGMITSFNAMLASLGLPTQVRSIGHMNNGADNGELLAQNFEKTRDDTVLQLSFNGGARIIGNGHFCRWYFMVDNQPCRDSSGHARGDIDTKFHGSANVDLHRTMLLEGVCFRNAAGVVKKGNHKISLRVEGNGDCYTGWSSNNRFTVREIVKPGNILG